MATKQKGQGLAVMTRKVSELANDPANARKHDDRNIEAIKASLQRFGQQKPIVVDSSGVVRAGNGTLQAAKALGWETIECVVTDLKGAEATAYAIADNRSAELAEWDDDVLTATLQSLADEDPSLLVDAGFDEKELARLVAQTAEPLEDDEVPEPPADPVTKPGDLWLLGEHRLLCGDSTDAACVSRLLGDRKPFIMVTDPPYGVNYEPGWRDGVVGEFGSGARVKSAVRNDHEADWTTTYKLFGGHVAYVWHAGKFTGDLIVDLVESGFDIRSQIVWRKQHFALSRGDYHWQHEPCWYAVRKGGTSKWCGDRTQSTIWDIASLNPAGRTEERVNHGTQKPIECMARPIRNHGGKEDDVYDPFLGSGTTLIAAEQLGRKCYGLEIDPAYCDVIVARWEKLTGRKAELEQR